ncbi:MAG: DUF4175 family protein [Myxococcales bacterium]|nr:DUF4175 family protein [Myxococcales bacterium]
MASPAPNLSQLLRGVRCVVLGAALLRAAAYLSALAGAITVTLSLFSLEPVPAGLVGALRLVFFLGAGAILVWHVALPVFRWSPTPRLARFIEQKAHAAPLELVGAVQFERSLQRADGEDVGISLELARAHVERMVAWLAGVRRWRLVEARRLWLACGTWLVVCVAVVAAAVLVSQDLRRAASLLLSPPRVAAEERTPSPIGDIRLIYHYPAYTGRPDRLLDGTDGAILALPGTEVEIDATCDRELGRAELRLGELRLPLRIQDRHLSGRLLVMSEGGYRFALEDRSGRTLFEDRLRPVRLELDQPPRVELRQPADDLTRRADEGVDLQFDARDDFGLSRVRLVWRVAGREERQGEKVLRQLSGERSARYGVRWELAGHDFRPGERVQFYVEAQDNDTVRGPKSGRSASRTINIFSPEAQRRETSRLAREAWEEMITLLSIALELDPSVRLPDVTGEEALGAMLRGLRGLDERLAQLWQRTRNDAASATLHRALARIRAGLRRQLDGFSYQELRPDDEAEGRVLRVRRVWRMGEGSLVGLEPDRQILVRRLEMDVLYLEDLLERERIQDLERLAEELEATRQRLQRLLEEYRRAPSDEMRRRIEAEMAALRAQLEALRARQAEVAQLRDEYLNPQALQKALERADMGSALERLERLFREGQLDSALAELERLGRQSRDFRAEVAQALAHFGERRYRELAAAIARLRGEITELTAAQRRLLESTGQLRERQLRALSRHSVQGLREAMRRLRALLRSLRESLGKLRQEELGHFAQQDLEAARRQAELLDPLLEAGEVARSLEVARELSQSADHLKESLAADLAAARRFEPQQVRLLEPQLGHAQEAQKLARLVEEGLRRLVPDPKDMLSAPDQQLLERLARDQRDLAQRLRRAQAEFERMNQQAPLFGRDMLGGARRAGKRMDGAAGELSRKNAPGAYPLEQSALAELEKLDRAMQQSCRRGSAGGGEGMPLPMGAEGDGEDGEGMDEGGPGGRMSREEVEVPRPEDFEPPDRLRRELLEGMKDPVPPDFEAQVRRYYQEIVR